jgi:hypothetical protein
MAEVFDSGWFCVDPELRGLRHGLSRRPDSLSVHRMKDGVTGEVETTDLVIDRDEHNIYLDWCGIFPGALYRVFASVDNSPRIDHLDIKITFDVPTPKPPPPDHKPGRRKIRL